MTFQTSILARACMPVAMALLASLPALASAAGDTVIQSTSAQITGLSYRLIDLDTNDGIDPSLTFDLTAGGINAVTYNNRLGIQDGQYDDTYFVGLTPEASKTVSFNGATASAGPSGYSTSVQTTVDQHINLAPSAGYGGATTFNANVSTFPDGVNYTNMTLSANTLLVITGTASITSQNNLQPLLAELNLLNPGQEAWASIAPDSGARIELNLERRNIDPNNIQSETDTSNFLLNTYGADPVNDINSAFTLQFANVGGASSDLSFTVGVGVTNAIVSGLDSIVIIDPPPSIPEPGTYMLMGLGLVGIGCARRRARA